MKKYKFSVPAAIESQSADERKFVRVFSYNELIWLHYIIFRMAEFVSWWEDYDETRINDFKVSIMLPSLINDSLQQIVDAMSTGMSGGMDSGQAERLVLAVEDIANQSIGEFATEEISQTFDGLRDFISDLIAETIGGTPSAIASLVDGMVDGSIPVSMVISMMEMMNSRGNALMIVSAIKSLCQCMSGNGEDEVGSVIDYGVVDEPPSLYSGAKKGEKSGLFLPVLNEDDVDGDRLKVYLNMPVEKGRSASMELGVFDSDITPEPVPTDGTDDSYVYSVTVDVYRSDGVLVVGSVPIQDLGIVSGFEDVNGADSAVVNITYKTTLNYEEILDRVTEIVNGQGGVVNLIDEVLDLRMTMEAGTSYTPPKPAPAYRVVYWRGRVEKNYYYGDILSAMENSPPTWPEGSGGIGSGSQLV